MIEIVLAGAPLAKGRPRFTKEGRAFTPERTRNYEARMAWAAQEAMRGKRLLAGPLAVDFEIRMQIPKSKSKKFKAAAAAGKEWPTKKPDFDNFAKICDALNLIVWEDDAQICKANIVKRYHEEPAYIIRVRPIETGVFE